LHFTGICNTFWKEFTSSPKKTLQGKGKRRQRQIIWLEQKQEYQEICYDTRPVIDGGNDSLKHNKIKMP
jgi:hypothetical protein